MQFICFLHCSHVTLRLNLMYPINNTGTTNKIDKIKLIRTFFFLAFSFTHSMIINNRRINNEKKKQNDQVQ